MATNTAAPRARESTKRPSYFSSLSIRRMQSRLDALREILFLLLLLLKLKKRERERDDGGSSSSSSSSRNGDTLRARIRRGCATSVFFSFFAPRPFHRRRSPEYGRCIFLPAGVKLFQDANGRFIRSRRRREESIERRSERASDLSKNYKPPALRSEYEVCVCVCVPVVKRIPAGFRD